MARPMPDAAPVTSAVSPSGSLPCRALPDLVDVQGAVNRNGVAVTYAFPTTISTACATSSGMPRRPIGTFLADPLRWDPIMSVSIRDGATALTVTPSLATRTA